MAWFFAVRPDAAARARILEACAAWRTEHRAIEPLRWTADRKLHYTLRYLGAVDPSRLDALVAIGRAVAAGRAPFALSMQHLGAFPSESRAKVVWLGAGAGSEELAAMARELDASLGEVGFAPDDRPFVAHLTLARLSDRVKLGPLGEAIAARRELSLGAVRVEAIELMESRPNVDAYASLAAFPLA